MVEVERLLVRLIGDGSAYRTMIGKAQEQTKGFENSLKNANAKIARLGHTATRAGKRMTLGLTAPLVGFGALGVREFAKFDQAMTESTSIMSVTADQIKEMRDLSLSLSGKATQGPAEMAKSYFFLASAGLDAAQSMAALPQVAKFATAGAFDMALATDLLTDAQSALGLTSKDATKNLEGMARISDVLVKANTLANASVQQFSESLTNTAGATLKNFNKSVEEGVAVLAAYADQGVKAQVAGTNLTRVTLLLQQSAQKNAEDHRKLGFAVFDSTGKMRNYADIIANLETITKGMSDETKAATLSQLGFEARIQNAILPLIGSSEAIRRYQYELEKAGGTTDKVANSQMRSFSNQMKILRNQATALAIKIGNALSPALIFLNRLLQISLKWFSKLPSGVQALIGVMLILTATIGPLVWIIGSLITSLTVLIPLIGTVITFFSAFAVPIVIVIAVIALLVEVVLLLTVGWETLLDAVISFFKTAVSLTVTGIRIMYRVLVAFTGWLLMAFESFWTGDFVLAIIKGFIIASKKILDFVEFVRGQIISIFTGSASGGFDDFVKQLEGDLKKGAGNANFLATIGQIINEETAGKVANEPLVGSKKGEKSLEDVNSKLEILVQLQQEANNNNKNKIELQQLGL